MKIFSRFNTFCMMGAALMVAVVDAKAPMSVSVTLRGKTYEIEDVTTVDELQERLSEASGVDPSKQGRVLFDGKRLNPADTLEASGVSQGASLQIVPAKKKSSSSKAGAASAAAAAAAATTTAAPPASAGGGAGSLDDMMKSMMGGMDTSGLDEMMKGMGGGDGNAPSMQESMSMMSEMMNSPIFQEYMNDPERLEESRQMILNNPMLKGMMGNMPGMEELLNSPEAWREAMQAAANIYQNMDPNDLMQAMSGAGGMPGMGGGAPGGLFDGSMGAGASALDELSEGED